MKKQFTFLITIFFFLFFSSQVLSQNLLVKDTIKVCITTDPKALDQYLINGLSQVKWEGKGVVQMGNSFYFDLAGIGQGIYNLSVAAMLNGNSVSDTLTVLVRDIPNAHAGKYDSICVNNNPFILDKALPQGPTGKWFYQGLDKTRWDSISNEADPASLKPGTHFYAYVYTVPNTVCRDTAYTSLTINPLPEPQILTTWRLNNPVNKICITDEPKLLQGNSIENGYAYLGRRWDGRGISALTGNQYEFNPQNAGLGEHTLTYTVTNIFGCVGANTENVTVDGTALLDFSYKREGMKILFDASESNKHNFIWEFGDGDTSHYTNPSHSYSNAGKFTVKLTSNDLGKGNGNSCPDSSIIKEIEIYPLGINENRDDINLTYDRTVKVIQINSKDIDFKSFTIIDLNGKMVLTGSLDNNNSMKTDNLKPSIYIVSILTKSGITYQAKMNLN